MCEGGRGGLMCEGGRGGLMRDTHTNRYLVTLTSHP